MKKSFLVPITGASESGPPLAADTPAPDPSVAAPSKPRKRKVAAKRKRVSKRQAEANRRNAAKSTGPKTAAGKAASRENATKHNLCSRRIVLPCEDESEYRRHEEAIIRGWNPANEDELDMARRIARAGWRLTRAEDVGDAMADLTIVASKKEHGYPYPDNRSLDIQFLAAGICHTDAGQAMLVERYMVAAERTFHRHREALRKLQNDRFRRERLALPSDNARHAQTAALRPQTFAAPYALQMGSSCQFNPPATASAATEASTPHAAPTASPVELSENGNGFVAQIGLFGAHCTENTHAAPTEIPQNTASDFAQVAPINPEPNTELSAPPSEHPPQAAAESATDSAAPATAARTAPAQLASEVLPNSQRLATVTVGPSRNVIVIPDERLASPIGLGTAQRGDICRQAVQTAPQTGISNTSTPV